MPEEQLRDIVGAVGARIQSELEAQLQALTARHRQALDRMRHDTEAEAEQRWAAKVDAVRSEWSARLESEVAAARSEAEKRLVAESMRVRVEAEQAAAETAAHTRRELEQAIAAERHRADVRLEAERRRAAKELEQTRAALEAERHQAEIESAARKATPTLDPAGMLGVVRSIDAASALTEALTALARGAAAHAARSTLFVVNDSWLEDWTADGVTSLSRGSVRVDSPDAGILREAVQQGRIVSSDAHDQARRAPAFADLPPNRRALAVPIVVGGRVVAVLYGDEGLQAEEELPPTWTAALELLGHHASACLARLTAVRSLQLVQSGNAAGITTASAPSAASEDDQNARRYARLLVSEIKLYNEAAVAAGREKRDLLDRLKPEIERARRLYEERVSSAVTARGFYFHQELVHTLAGGDPGLLGA